MTRHRSTSINKSKTVDPITLENHNRLIYLGSETPLINCLHVDLPLNSSFIAHKASYYALTMATEEDTNPPSLPPYPQMIFEAIDALKQKEGSNKSSILNYIESTYGNLPSGGTALLTENLKNLKDSGELVLLRNNYMRPDPNSPLKRGRGRPSKPKDPAALEKNPATESGTEVKRGRGRPKKDPNAPPAVKKVKISTGSGRPRGRPRKVQPELTGVEVN